MSLYGRIFAALYDPFMSTAEESTFGPHRESLLARVRGRVIEIGGGTGANLPYYGAGVTEVVITEPEEPMAKRLEGKLRETSLPARVVRAPAEKLPVEDGSFDFAVSTLVLCTVDDPARSLREIRRVLKPGGQLVFLEHVRSDDPGLAKWQDRLHGLQYRVGHGCHCNRPTLANIERAGFAVASLERDTVKKAPPIVRPLIAGVASLPPPMISTNQFKNGTHIDVEGTIFKIVEFQHVKPGKGPAFVRTKLKRTTDGAVIDKTFRAGEKFRPVRTETRKMQFLYGDGSDAHFMDSETFEQFTIPEKTLEGTLKWVLPSEEVEILYVDNQPSDIQVPSAVEMAVTETEPGLRGDTASGGGDKPATLESGVTVRVPLFVNVGDRVRVDTRSGAYVARA